MAFKYLAEYATFSSVEDMDKHAFAHIDKHKYDLTKSEMKVLEYFRTNSLNYAGACHKKYSTIAESCGISEMTVCRSIKKLIELKIIGKSNKRKKNGIKGANIYFILPCDVVTEMLCREDTEKASNDNAFNDEKKELSSSSFNLFKTCSLSNIYNIAHAEKEASKEFMNQYQSMLFDFMYALPLDDRFKDELHKVVLAAQINSMSDFVKAKNVLFKIAMDIKDGVLTVTSTLRAIFSKAYTNAVERLNSKSSNSSSAEVEEHRERPVPFYNWLEERDGRPQVISSKPTIDNWLEW